MDSLDQPGGAPLPRVQRSSLNDDVYEAVREHILTGRLAADARIVEEKLASQLGVSRAPLREAIWQLKADGLIVGSGRSTRVVALSQRDIRELHLVRVTLETSLYQSAALLISDDDVTELQGLIQQMELASQERYWEQIADLDLRFHQMLCEISDLPRLRAVWQEQHVLFRLWLNLVAETREEAAVIAGHHRDLLAAVRSNDPVLIARETSHHVYCTGHALVEERRRWELEHAVLSGDPYGIAADKGAGPADGPLR